MVQVECVVNGRPARLHVPPFEPALYVLRERLGLTGTKEGCAEGDCGACTVALGTRRNGEVHFRAVNSCLLPAARLHGRYVVTVEGLAGPSRLHPIQQALLDYHAVQCGFCTPGLVMSIFCLLAEHRSPTDEEVAAALEGNICRCTGYESIRAAVRSLRGGSRKDIIPDYLSGIASIPAATDHDACSGNGFHAPRNLAELVGILKSEPNCRFLAGGTDLMLELDKHNISRIIDLSGLAELGHIGVKDGFLSIGAGVTLAELIVDQEVGRLFPAVGETLRQMGSAQVRNVATVAGNIANASPVADAAVLLLALGARLVLTSARTERRLPLEQFYIGYKQTALAPGEFIARVEVPLSSTPVAFVKTSKRGSVDIASVNSALALRLDGNTIADIRFALGGVAPFPMLSEAAVRCLLGRKLCSRTVLAAADAVAAEIKPIADVRGSESFRRTLAHNHLMLLFRRLFPDLVLAGT